MKNISDQNGALYTEGCAVGKASVTIFKAKRMVAMDVELAKLHVLHMQNGSLGVRGTPTTAPGDVTLR